MRIKREAVSRSNRRVVREGRAAAPGRPLWLFLTEPGLGPLLIKELKFIDAIAQKAQLAKLHLRNYDLLIAPDAVLTSRTMTPRLASHALICPVFGRERVSEHQFDQLAAFALREKSSSLVRSIAGERLSGPEFERLVARSLVDRGVRFAREPGRAMWLLAVDEKYYFGFPRFNYHEAKGRERISEREGSLPPVVAAAIVFAGKPVSGDVIWDPVMGTGTLLTEASAFVPQARLIGSDIDPDAVAMARKRLGTGARLIRAEVAHMSLKNEKISLTVANLPFGKKFVSADGNKSLYESVLRRSLAHATDNWRACLLTTDADALRESVDAVGHLVLSKITDVDVRGLRATIWLVARK